MRVNWSNYASVSTIFFDQLYPEIGILVQGKRLSKIEKKCKGKPSEAEQKIGRQFYELVLQFQKNGGEIDDLIKKTDDQDVLDLLKRVKTHQAKVPDRTHLYSKDGTAKSVSFPSILPSVSRASQWLLSYIPSSLVQSGNKDQA